MSHHNSIRTLEPQVTSVQPGTPRPVKPFALNCRFDRSRGEFVVRAGARAGGLVVVGAMLLAVGALGFAGDLIRGVSGRTTTEVAAQAPAAHEVAPVTTSTPKPVATARASEPSKSRAKPARQSGRAKSRAKAPVATARASSKPATVAKPKAPAAHPVEVAHGRQAGLNYLVIKSFPREAEATAARAALAARGVQATVERNLPGWAGRSWYSLVGTTGFDMDRQRSQFDRHVKELKALKLDPKPYKWRGPEFAAGQ